MTTWEEIRDEVAGALADGQPLEDVIAKLEKLKNEMEKPMANEEWFASLPTERKAHFFAERFGGSADRYNNIYDTMLEWLKEKHK